MPRDTHERAPNVIDGSAAPHRSCVPCVVGAPGSGTALLRRLLEAQPALGRLPSHLAPGYDSKMQPQVGIATTAKSLEEEDLGGEGALPALAQACPDLRVIHVIRDGRDCYAHRRETEWAGSPASLPTPEQDASQWVEAVTALRRDGAQASALLEVRYEDLILHAADTLERIRMFLGLSQALLGKLPTADDAQVQRWRETLLPHEITRFEAVAGPLLSECGYPTSSELQAQGDEATSRAFAERSLAALQRRDYVEAKYWATRALREDPVSPQRQHSLLSLAEWVEDLPVQWCMEFARDTALISRFEKSLQVWRGEPLDAAHRLFIWRTHRDLGADLRYSAILSNLGDRVAHCTVAVDGRLIPLLRRRFPALDIIPDTADPPAGTAYHASWELLGHFFLPGSHAMPGRPWLEPDPGRVAALAHGGAPAWRRPRVAIAWYSSNERKDLPSPAMWKPVLEVPGIEWVCAQYDAEQAGISELKCVGRPVRVESIDLRQDIDGLAALLASCDLLVSISGSQVHLAGGLGVPAWVVMRETPLLSWPLGNETSCWYPHTRCHWVRDESWELAMPALARKLQRWVWRWRIRHAWHALKNELNGRAGHASRE